MSRKEPLENECWFVSWRFIDAPALSRASPPVEYIVVLRPDGSNIE